MRSGAADDQVMSPPDPEQSPLRSVLSWESVVDGDDEAAESVPAASAATRSAAAPAPPPAPATPPPAPATPATTATDDVVLEPMSLTIEPLTLDPLPPIPDGPTSAPPAPEASVLGEIHLDLPPIVSDGGPDSESSAGASAAEPAPTAPTSASNPIDNLELTIAPLDVPEIAPSGATPVVTADPTPAEATAPAPAPAPIPDVAPSVVDLPAHTAVSSAEVSVVHVDPAPAVAEPAPVATTDATLTSVMASQAVETPTFSLPQHQPNQAHHRPTPSPFVVETPGSLSRKQKKQQKRQKKRAQKSGGAGGIALFFTLLVLVGLVVGAIIFGRPYLFPEKWEADAKPYGEAVEAAQGKELVEPLMLARQVESTYSLLMADELLGDWESELPTWRSLGLVKGEIDAPLLRDLVDGWVAAYYSPTTTEIYANESLTAAAVDGAITEAMAAASLDQDTKWSSSVDPADLDGTALNEAQVIDASRTIAAATPFGAGISERRIDVAAFLPPVLAYRVNAPLAYAELVPDSASRLDAITVDSLLELSARPELDAADVALTSQQQVGRSFWYLVFGSYTDASTAYAASNALVNSSLATTDRAGRSCTHGTFSGADEVGTAAITDVLLQWVTNAPVEMTSTLTTHADGTLQLTSCDPGVGFESAARFGVARELIRWRSVELAAVELVDPQIGTPEQRATEVDRVRQTQAGLSLMDLPYDTDAVESAEFARQAASPAAVIPVVGVGDGADVEGAQGEVDPDAEAVIEE